MDFSDGIAGHAEARFRAEHLAKNMIPKPRRIKGPRLKLK